MELSAAVVPRNGAPSCGAHALTHEAGTDAALEKAHRSSRSARRVCHAWVSATHAVGTMGQHSDWTKIGSPPSVDTQAEPRNAMRSGARGSNTAAREGAADRLRGSDAKA